MLNSMSSREASYWYSYRPGAQDTFWFAPITDQP